MGLLDSAIDYFIQNWVSILFTIFLASIFYYLSARGIKKVIASRQEERLKIAKESIIDVLEHQIINNSDIDTDKIIHLLNAISRERGVNLSNEYTYLDLLEDLELRFAKSKHLKNEQREEYIEKIENLLKKIEDEKSIIIPPYERVFNDLEESIEIKNTESINQNLKILRTKLILEKEKRNKPEETSRMIAIFMTGFMMIISATVFSGSEFSNISASEKNIILGTVVLLATVFLFLITLIIYLQKNKIIK